MSREAHADRAAAVLDVLRRAGIACDGVSIAGAAGDVAVIRTRSVDADALGAVTGRIKQLGFRYVTIDLQALGAGP